MLTKYMTLWIIFYCCSGKNGLRSTCGRSEGTQERPVSSKPRALELVAPVGRFPTPNLHSTLKTCLYSGQLRDTAAEGQYYNLQGIRVEPPARGLYIRDGKKVVVK